MSQTIVLRHQTPNYDLRIELVDMGTEQGFPLVHCDVFYWSPNVMRELQAVWPAFRSQFKGPVFACNPNEDHKWEKFLTKFGFRYFSNFIGPDDKEHKMFLHI